MKTKPKPSPGTATEPEKVPPTEPDEEQDDSTPDEDDTSESGGDGDGSREEAGEGKEEKTGEKAYSKKEVEDLIQKRLKSDREERRRKLEREQAEKQGNFQKLYETAQTELEEFKPYKERYEALSKRQNEAIDAEVKDWPVEAREFDPGSDDLEKRLEWLPKGRKLAQRLKVGGVPPDPEHGNKGTKSNSGNPLDSYLKKRYASPVKR